MRATTLDAYVTAHRVSRVDLIKIDVEGAELALLDGGIRTLAANPDILLVVEFARENARRFGHSVEDLESRLLSLGFRLFTITPKGLVRYTPVGELIANVVAVRRLDIVLHGIGAAAAAHLLLRLADISPANSAPGRLRRSGRPITRRRPG